RWTVALLVILSALVTVTMLRDWRRSVKPYRHMLTPETDFARDLPAGPPAAGEAAAPRPRGREIARGALVVALVGFWTWVCGRLRPADAEGPEDRWRAI